MEKCMRRAINCSFWPPLLVFLLIFAAVMAPGCQSLQRLKRSSTDDRWVCPEYADVPLRQGRFEEAIEQHLQVISQEPENGLAHYHLGYAYGHMGLHPDEIAEYLRAVDLGMVKGDLFYNLGMSYMQLQEYLRAEQAFLRAVELEPDCGENHRGLGLAYFKQEHYHEAIVSCRRATTLEPHDADSWHCLALAAAKSDEVGESWYAVKKIRKLDPDYTLDPFLLKIFPAKQKSPTPNASTEPRDPR
jgi:tetratricopeptide (TPR) repeat protein